MISLDSIKILFPYKGIVNSFNNMYYTEHIVKRNGIAYYTEYKLAGVKHEGLKSICINVVKDEVIIELSSKIIASTHASLISLLNIDDVFQEINNTGFIELNIPKAIRNSILLKCDVTCDLILSKDVPDYIFILQLYKLNPHYLVTSYGRNGVTFSNRAKSKYQRISFYDKCKESKNPRHKGVLRIERNLNSYQTIRDAFHIDKCRIVKQRGSKYIHCPDLLTVLHSKANPLLSLINEICNNLNSCLTLPSKLSDIEKHLGMMSLIKMCDYDIDIIKTVIKKRVKGDVSHIIKKYQTLMLYMHTTTIAPSMISDIDEIKQELSKI